MSLEPPNQSLRSHRQTANPHVMAAAVQKQKPYIQDSTHLQLPNVGDKDRERVGNMVKRRFSARIPGQGVPYDAAAAPSLPVGAGSMIDDAVAAGGVPVTKSKTMTSPAKAAPVASGASGMLLKEDLDAHTFVTQQLATSNAEEVDRFVSKLKSLKSRLVDEQREAMYTNYNSFLTVNKEILALNSEVKSLGQAVSNFNVAVSAMVEDALESTSSKSQESSQSSLALPDSSARNRNSMVMLENMWANELASLFKHVEGAVKYLPAIPGRHVVAESGAWYQLNAATWKPLRPVHMFLLNDHLLIAAKNRKKDNMQMQQTQTLVADQCWPLSDIEFLDLSVSRRGTHPVIPNAVSVVCGGVTCVYQTEKPAQHAKVVSAFKKVAGEGRKNDTNKTQQQIRLRESMTYYAARNPSLRGHKELLQGLSNSKGHSRSSSVDITGRTKNLREIDDLVNDLDVKIAHRRFAEATDIILENIKDDKESTDITQQVLDIKLHQRQDELVAHLIDDVATDTSNTAVTHALGLLVRLGHGDQARGVYLETRRNLIHKRTRQVELLGDIPGYIAQVAVTYFRLIRSTAEVFRKCYTDNHLASSIAEWAKSMVEEFVLLFARQLYGVKPDTQTYQQCVSITRQQAAQLSEVGLNLDYLLDYVLSPARASKA
ncbi:exocyst complex component EXO84 [Yarrowia lipolytica]|nr:exocyst complex component EXO84 [Yarrowia lipolytica]RDW53160.1 exocyst complex component EXO84 [Yarrowia lipolytica]